ncbi:MAG: hypothetical protein JWN95_1049 [Frankiales bacterium]|nr:hypothetical protein [Frankiales bacterium]
MAEGPGSTPPESNWPAQPEPFGGPDADRRPGDPDRSVLRPSPSSFGGVYPPISSGSFLPLSDSPPSTDQPHSPSMPGPAARAQAEPKSQKSPLKGPKSSKSPVAPRQQDPDAIDHLDWGVIAAGLVAFLFSLFDYYTYTAKIAGLQVSAGGSVSAWHGVFGWLAALLAFGSAGLLAVQLIVKLDLPFPVRAVGLAGFGLATVAVLLALFVVPDDGGVGGFGSSIDKGHGAGYWVSLVAIVAGLILSYQRREATSRGSS